MTTWSNESLIASASHNVTTELLSLDTAAQWWKLCAEPPTWATRIMMNMKQSYSLYQGRGIDFGIFRLCGQSLL
jgi:hypothetical protein